MDLAHARTKEKMGRSAPYASEASDSMATEAIGCACRGPATMQRSGPHGKCAAVASCIKLFTQLCKNLASSLQHGTTDLTFVSFQIFCPSFFGGDAFWAAKRPRANS